jgi:histidinol-phosphatase (PHP family)
VYDARRHGRIQSRDGPPEKLYGGRIALFTGVEQDYYATEPTDGYDYVIGSVHYIRKNGEYLLVDDCEENTVRDVARFYGGDFYAYTADYFRTVADIVPKTDPDLSGISTW